MSYHGVDFSLSHADFVDMLRDLYPPFFETDNSMRCDGALVGG